MTYKAQNSCQIKSEMCRGQNTKLKQASPMLLLNISTDMIMKNVVSLQRQWAERGGWEPGTHTFVGSATYYKCIIVMERWRD